MVKSGKTNYRWLLIYPDFGSTNLRSPPLGIGYLCANLKMHGIPFRLLDMSIDSLNPVAFTNFIREEPFRYVGISCYAWTFRYSQQIIPLIKSVRPDVPIVVGGTFASGDPEFVLEHIPDIDILIKGEAEERIIELDSRLESDSDWRDIPGVVYRQDNRIVIGPPQTVCREGPLSWPSPYLTSIYELHRYDYVYVAWSRGCPFSCVYCSWGSDRHGGDYRPWDTERIVEELVWIARHPNIRVVSLADGSANVPATRFHDICERVAAYDLPLSFWDLDLRGDYFEPRTVELLKAINTTEVGFGLESIHSVTQRRIKKYLKPEKLPSVVRMCKSAGIRVHVSYIIGLPGETEQQVRQTMAFCRDEIRPDRHGIFPLRLQAGTYLYENHEALGIRLLDFDDESGSFLAETDDLPLERIVSLHQEFCNDVPIVDTLSVYEEMLVRMAYLTR
jgi:radical SAM superfamily enzyme YgiQ (UPF0313 family)